MIWSFAKTPNILHMMTMRAYEVPKSLSDMARQSLLLVLNCEACARTAVLDPQEVTAFLHRACELDDLPFTCSECGTGDDLRIGHCATPETPAQVSKPQPLWSDGI